MRQSTNGILLAAAALLASACAPMRFDADYDPQIAFADFQTYAWLDSADIAKDLADESPFLERRIRRAVDQVLQERGFEARPEGEVDFHVTAFVVAPDHARVERVGWRPLPAPIIRFHLGIARPYAYGIGYPWHRYRYPYPYLRYPWGYASAYRLGFGYIWVPVYDRPDGQLPGTLVIDIYDCSTDELVWRGWAEGAMVGASDRDDIQTYLDEIVSGILADFPPLSR